MPGPTPAGPADSVTRRELDEILRRHTEGLMQVVAQLRGAFVFYDGSPEGFVVATPSVVCRDRVNGELYVKKSGAGNTGWKLITHA